MTPERAALLAAARAAEDRWTRAVLTGRRNSREYKAAHVERVEANRALLAYRLANPGK
jgi:hypothetical protein